MSTNYPTGAWVATTQHPLMDMVMVHVERIAGDWSAFPERVQIVPADAIVIDRATLPEVIVRPGEFHVGTLATDSAGLTAGDARTAAHEWFAIAEYLDAHPPVDEADVETLAGLLGRTDITATPNIKEIARRLLATGRVEVKRP